MKEGETTEKEPVAKSVSLPTGSQTKGTKETNTDAQGLDKAYQRGNVFANNNKLYVFGNHTPRDWFGGFTKLRQWQYIPSGMNSNVDVMNSWRGRELIGTRDLRKSEQGHNLAGGRCVATAEKFS